MPASRVCSTPGCPTLTQGGRCATHKQAAEQARGSASARGYGTAGHARFRTAVLKRDPLCVLCHLQASTDADHYPLSRRELVLRKLDPNDPRHGRGLCSTCHKRETALHQPGGWHAGISPDA